MLSTHKRAYTTSEWDCIFFGSVIYGLVCLASIAIIIATIVIYHDYDKDDKLSVERYKHINRALIIFPILAIAILTIVCCVRPFKTYVHDEFYTIAKKTALVVGGILGVFIFFFSVISYGIQMVPMDT